MRDLTPEDAALVRRAAQAIRENYDAERLNHTVGAAVRCGDGTVFTGVNVYSVHGACAELIAIGAAITAGKRDFACIAAVGGEKSDRVYPPCGNCRQLLSDYAPGCDIIVPTLQGLKKAKAEELLPFSYHAENE